MNIEDFTITKLIDGKMTEVSPDSVFRSGDRIRITIVPNSPGYLYIVNQGSSGTWKPLFPSPEVEDGNNRVDGFRDYSMPPKSRMVFDSQAGTEKLFVILSREPEPDFEHLKGTTTSDRIDLFRRHQVEMPLVGLSATELRRRIAAGLSIRYRTPRAVEKYIETHGLYREG